ncbi:putative secreted protein [Wickerhamomyces ciferrii]|uniref:Secreted protein n=1 Tax=Wickerhamomyces ciferrii (strain ATCC 14091 / BCRC 22168 / CBS 111 / JCM 3599 / NBRC 0793 / NRRL Y-1031 F-60-10) TaxID=1206466 RepID=K0KMC1_WICCF|nr:uncharacterized protein BN7_6004 [Wickerhamomyces ciferrii]CCH46410.1 putative secreted protein [Wickerhamomyces ciferrii]
MLFIKTFLTLLLVSITTVLSVDSTPNFFKTLSDSKGNYTLTFTNDQIPINSSSTLSVRGRLLGSNVQVLQVIGSSNIDGGFHPPGSPSGDTSVYASYPIPTNISNNESISLYISVSTIDGSKFPKDVSLNIFGGFSVKGGDSTQFETTFS